MSNINSKELTTIKKSEPILKIVEKINELIELSNDNKYLLDSFRNVHEEVDISYKGLEIDKKIIKIQTSGMYRIQLTSAKGKLEVFINENNGTPELSYQLSGENPSIDNILLLNGDEILLTDKKLDIDSVVDIKLIKNFSKMLNDTFFDLENFIKKIDDDIKHINSVSDNNDKILLDLSIIKEDFVKESKIILQDIENVKDTVVLKEEGKGLSTNDYDDTAQLKVNNIPENIDYTSLATKKELEDVSLFEDGGKVYKSKFMTINGEPILRVEEVK